MKTCPHCAEEIDPEAVKCPFCREFVDEDQARPELKKGKKVPWYFKTGPLIFILLSVGPLGLPLLWLNPRYKPLTKIIWTAVTLALSYVLIKMSYQGMQTMQQTYEQLQQLYYPEGAVQ